MGDDGGKPSFRAVGALLTASGKGARSLARRFSGPDWKKRGGLSMSVPFVLLALILIQPSGCKQEAVIPVEDEDISAAAIVGNRYLVLGSDEKHHLYVWLLGERRERFGSPLGLIELASASEGELDIEAIAVDGPTLYVAGSHSKARRRADDEKTQLENRERIAVVRAEEDRARIFRFDLDLETVVRREIVDISLARRLETDEILGAFAGIASKENGVDIEGLAVKDGMLYVGFRSPVLRDNYVPMLRTSFESPESGDVLFLDLDGLGIRDLAATSSGFLVLAGPSNDAPGDSVLYYWTGNDGLVGKDRRNGVVQRIRKIDTPRNGVAEGLAIVASQGRCHDLLVVFDGVPGGAPQELRACTPR